VRTHVEEPAGRHVLFQLAERSPKRMDPAFSLLGVTLINHLFVGGEDTRRIRLGILVNEAARHAANDRTALAISGARAGIDLLDIQGSKVR
jgi:hypothetical protein